MKSIVISAAALALVGGAAGGIAAVAPSSGLAGVQLAAVGAPRPQDPVPAPPGQGPAHAGPAVQPVHASDRPGGVSYTTKTNLVENGITPDEGHVADHDLRKAYRDGKFPETFNVMNIAPAGPNAVQADVAISGPKFAGPVTKHLAFINQGGNWVLQHDAALALVQAATS